MYSQLLGEREGCEVGGHLGEAPVPAIELLAAAIAGPGAPESGVRGQGGLEAGRLPGHLVAPAQPEQAEQQYPEHEGPAPLPLLGRHPSRRCLLSLALGPLGLQLPRRRALSPGSRRLSSALSGSRETRSRRGAPDSFLWPGNPSPRAAPPPAPRLMALTRLTEGLLAPTSAAAA